ncbi:hypothetical protein CC86DRAFT_367516 [Ophiobolus disseminans]|uniref:Uncharacterized protein n=1 Tax=Ophiobolus disseminans TaxID=1469910 RepID=A0A6A7AE55_9PLEO|nr:hypothetical protein CC86DRAFT_367516 [Ophiobolus disseminans]
MPGFLDLPLEIRNYVYDLLLWEELDKPQFRGVMVVKEAYIKNDLPLRCYRGLLPVCRQIHSEVKKGIQHMVASKRLIYDMTMTFSHGRPYFSLTWLRFPALSPTINHLSIAIDLRTREPLRDSALGPFIPHEHELAHLLEDSPESFAGQLFNYIPILLKCLANLLSHGNPNFAVLYTECMTLNLRTPTKAVGSSGNGFNPISMCRRVPVDREEARKLHATMQNTLKAKSKGFKAFDARDCDRLVPLIQVGSLRFATEGRVWAEGHNLVLARDHFQWLRY